MKSIINIKSKSFQKYRMNCQCRLCAIPLIFMVDMYTIYEICKWFTAESVDWLFFFGIIPTYWFFKKYQKGKYFQSSPDNYDDIARKNISYTNEEKNKLLKKANAQLKANKKSVVDTFKVIKWIFAVVIVGTFEDNIKSLFNLNNFKGDLFTLRFLCEISLILFIINWLIGPIFDSTRKFKNNIDNFINTCIDNGLFVRNYTLLKATIYILNKTQK